MTFRLPLIWAALLAASVMGLVVCAVAWFILLSGICLNPRATDPQTQHLVPYNCHGMKVFITPLDHAQLTWLGPAGMLFGVLAFLSGTVVSHTIAKTLRNGSTPHRVRVIAVPPGEAPDWVREKWVGLDLPLAQAPSATTWRSKGVLTGSRTRTQAGFIIGVLDAVAVLERTSPEAAAWWRANAAHMMKPARCFVFPENVCSVIAPEGGRAPQD